MANPAGRAGLLRHAHRRKILKAATTIRTEASMTNVTIIRRSADPLGYEGDVLDRLRAMAEDELAGIGAAAVDEDAAILRARLGLSKEGRAFHGINPRR
jgi:hypothetical protein